MDRRIYKSIEGSFYFKAKRSLNPMSRYYHSSRYKTIRSFVNSRYNEGMKILDVGSGGSVWNIERLPVTGLDINTDFLEEGKKAGSISEIIVHDLGKLPLPIKNESYDIIIISEVLEHMTNYKAILKESYRILKKGGFLVLTVPYDTKFSPWNFLFGLQCFLKGDVLRDEYYENRCGHVNHFSPEDLVRMIKNMGFEVFKKKITLLNVALFLIKPK